MSRPPALLRSVLAVHREALSQPCANFRLVIPPVIRHSSSAATPQPQPKRPSPYRLIAPHTFLAQFAPLHVAGWRLDLLPASQSAPVSERRAVEEGMADLQDRRLVRLYEFESGRHGWGDLVRFVGRVGQAVGEQDHHPKILITPAQDYVPSLLSPTSPQSGYLLELSTHTHTPLPATPVKSGQAGSKEKMRPGVTTKDLKLADLVEEIWRDISGGVVA